MSDIRLIALDLDGTVFDDNKNISPRTLAALRAALNKGVDVIPATGRSVTGVPEVFLHMPGVRYALTTNGATVIELATNRKLVELSFAPETALRIFEILRPFPGLLSVFVGGESFIEEGDYARYEEIVPLALRPYFDDSRRRIRNLPDYVQKHAGEVEKFSIIYASDEIRDAAQKAVLAECEAEAVSSLPRNLELNAPGVSKGRGLMVLTEKLKLRPEQVMACGDGGNDLEMVKMAGLGVAMANAAPAVKAAANYITADNNHDGVALAIEKFVL